MYSLGESWKTWMKDYRFGTLVFLPSGELKKSIDDLRREFDFESFISCGAHITITQPFTSAPDKNEINLIKDLIADVDNFSVEVGPAISSPNDVLIWLDVNPKDKILTIREKLHKTNLFRTDLPFTEGFIPHMTISELRREPENVMSIVKEMNLTQMLWTPQFDSIAWIIPDENFVFKTHQIFELGL